MKRLLFFLFLFSSLAWAQKQGPLFPTTATGNTNTIGGGVGAWTNPTNIEAADGVNATFGLGNSSTSADLIGQGFGFSIPSNSTGINGILFELNVTSLTATQNGFHNIRLLKAGVAAGNDKATGTDCACTTATTFSFGGSTDLWGTTWTISDINNSGFGADSSWSSGPSGSSNLSTDFYRITVFFQGGASQMLKVFAQTSTPGGHPVTWELSGDQFNSDPFEIKGHAMKQIQGHQPQQSVDLHPSLSGDHREVASVNVHNPRPRSKFQGRRAHGFRPAYTAVALRQRRARIHDQIRRVPI